MLDIRFIPRALQGFSLQRFERKSNPLGAFFGSSGGEEALVQPPPFPSLLTYTSLVAS